MDWMLPILIPKDMPDWMGSAYKSLDNHVIAFSGDLTSVETHFQAMKSINMAIIQTTHKKGLISTGLHCQFIPFMENRNLDEDDIPWIELKIR